jgi:hypothetical protein
VSKPYLAKNVKMTPPHCCSHSLLANPNYSMKHKFGTFVPEATFMFNEGREIKISKWI